MIAFLTANYLLQTSSKIKYPLESIFARRLIISWCHNIWCTAIKKSFLPIHTIAHAAHKNHCPQHFSEAEIDVWVRNRTFLMPTINDYPVRQPAAPSDVRPIDDRPPRDICDRSVVYNGHKTDIDLLWFDANLKRIIDNSFFMPGKRATDD